MVVSFDPKQETNDFGTSNSGTSNSVFSSVELEIGAIISFKVISWYEVTLLLLYALNRLCCSTLALNYQSIRRQYSCAVDRCCQREDSNKHAANQRQSLKAIVQAEVEAMTSQPVSQPVTTLALPTLVSL